MILSNIQGYSSIASRFMCDFDTVQQQSTGFQLTVRGLDSSCDTCSGTDKVTCYSCGRLYIVSVFTRVRHHSRPRPHAADVCRCDTNTRQYLPYRYVKKLTGSQASAPWSLAKASGQFEAKAPKTLLPMRCHHATDGLGLKVLAMASNSVCFMELGHLNYGDYSVVKEQSLLHPGQLLANILWGSFRSIHN